MKTPPIQFGWKKTLIYSLLPAVVLFAVLETGARVAEIWWPPLHADYGWGFNPESRLYVPSAKKPGFMETNPAKRANFHHEQFAVPKSPGTFRIFILGGSSVNYLQWRLKRLALTSSLQFATKFWLEIIDAGGLTYGSHRLLPIAVEIMKYEPDMVLIYSGHNEFEELRQLQLARPSAVALQRFLYSSAFARFIRDRLALARLERLRHAHNTEILANPDPNTVLGQAWDHRFTPEEIAGRMEKYRQNLSLIIETCQAHNVAVIIGTVPSNHVKPALVFEYEQQYAEEVTPLFEKGEYEQGYALGRRILAGTIRHQSSDEENAIIRELATQYQIPLADVESAVAAKEPNGVPGQTLFNDSCHLNDEGMAILIDTYRDEIVKILEEAPAGYAAALRKAGR